ncbi:MAG: D-glucuronyl C5-epimerase family protein, partial [Actinomycetota bacterium]|nr:D-glucuronyl C5-epimerase family protein [Actinomycetota bacterium]
THRRARALAARLTGLRRQELGAAVAGVEDLAARGLLTVSRMPAAFLTLQRNAEFWPERSFPRPPQPSRRPCAGAAGLGGARVTFEGDPVIFQWYAGQGLQIQPLANFGKANALWREGEAEALRALLDRMLALGAQRGSFLAWEYAFAFGGGRAPWISGLAQGTGIQALTRGAELLDEPRYLAAARRALGAFEAAPPLGVRVRESGGSHYLIYSYAPGLRVLNGFLQALVGLFEHAEATGDRRAQRLFAAGDRAARRAVPRFDTGAWSLYSAGGRESDLGYHRLVRDFLRSLCERTRAGVYCSTERRFTRYLGEPTRLALPPLPRVRAGATASLRFTLSKVSCVLLTVRRTDAPGRIVHRATLVLGRGGHALPFRPLGAGEYLVEVEARDLVDHRTRLATTLVTRPRRARG